jgi:hypothetical protein
MEVGDGEGAKTFNTLLISNSAPASTSILQLLLFQFSWNEAPPESPSVASLSPKSSSSW